MKTCDKVLSVVIKRFKFEPCNMQKKMLCVKKKQKTKHFLPILLSFDTIIFP